MSDVRHPLNRPRPDNPSPVTDPSTGRCALACTDCGQIVGALDVSYWNDMPKGMVDADATQRAVDSFNEWLRHMSAVHGITPNWPKEPRLP